MAPDGATPMSASPEEGRDRRTAAGDTALLARLRAGDEDAFLTLVDACAPAMRKLARAYVRDDQTAEDIVQEAWLAVLRGLESFEGRGSLRGWIFAIVANLAKTRGVRDARSVPFSALVRDEVERDDPSYPAERFAGPASQWPDHWRGFPAVWGEHPEERLLSSEMQSHIERAIDMLPPAQRAVVLLRDVGGRSTADVCDLLELSEANARVLLHRARAKVRRAIEPYVTGAAA